MTTLTAKALLDENYSGVQLLGQSYTWKLNLHFVEAQN